MNVSMVWPWSRRAKALTTPHLVTPTFHIRANNRPTYHYVEKVLVVIHKLELNPSPECQHHHHPSIGYKQPPGATRQKILRCSLQESLIDSTTRRMRRCECDAGTVVPGKMTRKVKVQSKLHSIE